MPWNDPDPAKDFARKQVKYAVKSGRLFKPKKCFECGSDDYVIHAHHDNYDKPLDVIWLCPQCHKDRHHSINKYGIEQVVALDVIYEEAVSVAKKLTDPFPAPLTINTEQGSA